MISLLNQTVVVKFTQLDGSSCWVVLPHADYVDSLNKLQELQRLWNKEVKP